MKYLNRPTCLILIVAAFILSCAENNPNSPVGIQQIEKPEADWKELRLPQEVGHLVVNNGYLLAFGYKSGFEVNEFGGFRELPPYVFRSKYLTSSGGLHLHRPNTNDAVEPFGCNPGSIAVLGGTIYIHEFCDPLMMMLTRVTLRDNETLLDIVGFEGGPFNPGAGYGPDTMLDQSGPLIFGSEFREAPQLLGDADGNLQLEVIWRGSRTDGIIRSLSFVGSTGWMLLESGKVLRSQDSGKTWRTLTTLGDAEQKNANSLAFRTRDEGLIVGDHGLVMTSTDGGATWMKESSGIDSNLASPRFRDGLILADCGKICLRDAEGKWTEIDPPGRLDTAEIFAGRVYLTLSGKLFYRDIAGTKQ